MRIIGDMARLSNLDRMKFYRLINGFVLKSGGDALKSGNHLNERGIC